MKVMVAVEPRAYRGAIGEAVGMLRPGLEVVVAEPEELGAAVTRSEPDVVLCGRRKGAGCEGGPIWVEYRPYTGPRATVCIRGRCEEVDVVGLGDLLAIVDRAEELVRAGVPLTAADP